MQNKRRNVYTSKRNNTRKSPLEKIMLSLVSKIIGLRSVYLFIYIIHFNYFASQ
jgi:hypothetical protein